MSGQILDRIRYYSRIRKGARLKDAILFAGQSAAATSTTVLLGLGEVRPDLRIFRELAFVVSAATSFLALILGRFRYRERHVAYTNTRAALQTLKYRLDFAVASNADKPDPEQLRHEIRDLHRDFVMVLEASEERREGILMSGIASPSDQVNLHPRPNPSRASGPQ